MAASGVRETKLAECGKFDVTQEIFRPGRVVQDPGDAGQVGEDGVPIWGG